MTSSPEGKPEIRIADWLKEGWSIVSADIGMFILASLIYNLIIGTCIGGLILYGPLTCGFYLIIFDRMRGEKPRLKRLFSGFEFFGDSFFPGFFFFILAGIGISLASAVIGIVILVLAQTIFLFAFPLISERRAVSVDAISKSFDAVRDNFWQYSLFALLLIIIHTIGFFLVIGWLITTPLVIAASAVAYRNVFGPLAPPPKGDIIL